MRRAEIHKILERSSVLGFQLSLWIDILYNRRSPCDGNKPKKSLANPMCTVDRCVFKSPRGIRLPAYAVQSFSTMSQARSSLKGFRPSTLGATELSYLSHITSRRVAADRRASRLMESSNPPKNSAADATTASLVYSANQHCRMLGTPLHDWLISNRGCLRIKVQNTIHHTHFSQTRGNSASHCSLQLLDSGCCLCGLKNRDGRFVGSSRVPEDRSTYDI